MPDGTIIPGIENLVRLATSDSLRDESFTQMKLKTQNRGYTYPDVDREEITLFEKQMCALVRRKVGQKTRVDHQNKRGDQYKSDAPDSLRMVLDIAEGYVDFDGKDEDADLKRESVSRTEKRSRRITSDDMEDGDYGIKRKSKRW